MRLSSMGWRKGVAAVLLLMVPACIGFPGVWALESDSGTLLGVITTGDGGSVHSGAVVQVRNTVTGEIYKSSPADELGMYISREVPFGTYDLAVETEKGFFDIGPGGRKKYRAPGNFPGPGRGRGGGFLKEGRGLVEVPGGYRGDLRGCGGHGSGGGQAV